jgi:hypothetical protein
MPPSAAITSCPTDRAVRDRQSGGFPGTTGDDCGWRSATHKGAIGDGNRAANGAKCSTDGRWRGRILRTRCRAAGESIRDSPDDGDGALPSDSGAKATLRGDRDAAPQVCCRCQDIGTGRDIDLGA